MVQIEPASGPDISIVIPVYNEETVINDALERLYREQAGLSFELIVVDGNGGGTLRVIEREDVRQIHSPPGRGCQMNRGAEAASGEILLFLHADTRLPPGALILIKSTLDSVPCKAGAFDLAINSDKMIFKIIARLSSLRSRLTREPYGDQAIFIKRGYFLEELGGYKEMPLMEDVELMRRIKRGGSTIHIISQTVSTSPRRWLKEGVLRCTLRNWVLITLYNLGVSPVKLADFYRQPGTYNSD